MGSPSRFYDLINILNILCSEGKFKKKKKMLILGHKMEPKGPKLIIKIFFLKKVIN